MQGGGPWTYRLIQNCDWLPVSIEPDCLVRGIIDHKPKRFAKRGDLCWEAIEHLPHDPEEFLDADDRRHENWAQYGPLCENDGMRAKILPPDFVTRCGFLLLCAPTPGRQTGAREAPDAGRQANEKLGRAEGVVPA